MATKGEGADGATDDVGDDGGDGSDSGDVGDGGDGTDGGEDDPDADGDGSPASEDCDDTNPDVYPFADEYCNGVDDDCDGDTDESTAVDVGRWYADEDGDGYGDDDEVVYACDAPSGTAAEGGDCDDGDAAQHPGADELCNGVDDNCNDEADELGAIDGHPYYPDTDGDSYGDDSAMVLSCTAVAGMVATGGDCDDADTAVNPGATEVCDDGGADEDCDGLVDDADDSLDLSSADDFYADTDADGYGDPGALTRACVARAGLVADATDCDDGDSSIHPAATEVCGGGDEDCDGLANDADPSVDLSTTATWYLDADTDGYGSSTTSTTACSDPSDGSTAWSSLSTDCDDGATHVNPGQSEICDAADTDEDCSGAADDSDAGVDTATFTTFYFDSDGDGYGLTTTTTAACDLPSGYATLDGDCDDADTAIHPGATEICDSAATDEDCDGLSDDDDTSLDTTTATEWHPDADGDTYGDSDSSQYACVDPTDSTLDWVTDNTDCDDDDSGVHPGATELCDAVDNDCDPTTIASGAAFTNASGTASSVTSTYASGTSSSPATATLSSNGTLSFCGSTWYVNLTVSADVTVTGSDGAILDGGSSAPVFAMSGSGRDLTVQGLTVQRGYGKYRSGSWGSYSYRGGGIYCSDSSGSSTITVEDSTFSSNAATYGGAIYSDTCDIAVDGSIFDGNSATSGGGIYLTDADGAVVDSELTDNSGSSSGGAIYHYYGTSLELEDTLIEGNSAQDGGAIYLFYVDDLTLTDSEVSDNAASDDGGGVFGFNSDISMTDTIFADNTATGSGGGIWTSDTSTSRTANVVCTESASGVSGFFRNTASGGSYDPGAVDIGTKATLTSNGCDFGTGTDDNSPTDVVTNSFTQWSFGDDQTFYCHPSTGCY